LTILIIAIEFICGALMFSYWLGLAAKKDIRKVGDGNPGAANLLQAAGVPIGLAGVFLDVMKGYLPLAIFLQQGLIAGMAVVPAALAPILGHAFSPFMKFRGGKCVAVTFGVWAALTRLEAAIAYAVILALLLLGVKLLRKGKPVTSDMDGFMVVLGVLLLGIYVSLRPFPPHLLLVWLGNFLIMAYANREKLFRVYREVLGKKGEEQEHKNRV
jgi:acyl-phosphate glycerol 3-phosphate acyltransferase